MSASVRLSAALPGNEEINGLDNYADRMADDLDTVVCALVWFDVAKVTESIDDEGNVSRVPTARIRKVEPIGDSPETKRRAAELYTELNEARLHMTPLPFDQLQGRTERVEVSSIDNEPELPDDDR